MSLSRKFKQAFLRHYNYNSPWLLVPIFLSGGVGSYGVGSAVYDPPSEKPLAPLTQEATAREKAVLGQHLNLVGMSYKEYNEINDALQKAEKSMAQADDVTAARDKLAKLMMDKLEARFNLDDQTQKFHHFVLQKTSLPEATVQDTVNAYGVQWDLPAKVTMSYNYRDEVRAAFDPTGLSATAATQKMHALEESAESNGSFGVVITSFLGFMGGMASSFLALGIGGSNLRRHFQDSLRREEDRERERQREIARLEKEKREKLELENNPPAPAPIPPAPPPPEPPAPQKQAQQFRL